MRKSILLLVLFAVSLPFQAQSPYLVRDINTTVSFDTSSSSPAGFTLYRDRTFFVATTDETGTELWSSGGNGAALVADIIPGISSGNPGGLKVVHEALLFNARSVDHGIELWATDGTAAGTRLLLDINPGPSSSQPGTKFTFGNRMLFSADDGTNGRELWTSDGTAGGTRMVLDLNPGAASSFPANFSVLGNSVYFVAAGGLWKTDGTAAGTVKVSSVPARFLTVAGAQLFFEGSTGSTNWEPWVSDGTAAGTRMVADIIPGTKGSMASPYGPSGFTPVGNQVLFLANDDVHGRELWISDGTSAGTRMTRDLVPGAVGMWDESDLYIGASGNRAWFAARDAEHGEELWVTDGTEAGTALFLDLVPGQGSSEPFAFAAANGKLFFTAASRLWVTDGSAGGTRALGGTAGPGLDFGTITAIDGKVFFSGSTALYGTEPWVSDGTDAGTRMLANLGADVAPSSWPFTLTATSDLLFFYAREGTRSPTTNSSEYSLWRSDGTAGGTFKLREAGQHVGELTAAGPFVFFKQNVNAQTLLMSDGTIEGTRAAASFMTRFGGGELETLFPFGDTLFAAVVPPNGHEPVLWTTVAASNAPAVELGTREPDGLIEWAGHYAFHARTQDGSGRGLWTTDGTPAGTYAIVPDLGADNQGLSPLVNAAGTIYFLKAERDQNTKLWKSDGTMDGTTVVRELPDVAVYRGGLAAAGRRVFIASRGTLRTSDGTEAGTVELTTPEISTAFASDIFEPVGDRVLFRTHTDATGYELWSSDGTQSGTIMLARSSSALVNVEGLIYFAGTDEQHGTELWTTDGTAAGTQLLIDLNPGPAGSEPGGFSQIGSTIYFSAYTESAGRELWALPLTGPRLSIADARASEGDAASVAVRFPVSLTAAPAQAVSVDYATADLTASAGHDYEAAAGTLTFLPGETTKFIDVRVSGDTFAENNETFVVRLSNASGARVVRREAAGIIDDEDQAADLSVEPSFAENGSVLSDVVRVSNLGSRAATDIAVTVTSTPARGAQRCAPCLISQLAVGDSLTAGYDSSWPAEQIYLSGIATARQGDPRTSNNSTSWTVNYFRTMAMSPGWLTPGETATLTAMTTLAVTNVTVSDPSVVAMSSPVTKVSNNMVTFTLTALKPGTAVIYLDNQQRNLLVTVVEEGQTPRWPGALAVSTDFTATRFDHPVTVTIKPEGVAPLTAATATGTILVTAANHELTRRTIGGTGAISFPLYLPVLGANNIQVLYSGDANFLPQTFNSSVFVRQGDVSITGTLVRVAGTVGTYTLALQAAGSPLAAPTGVVTVLHGSTALVTIPLEPSSGGTSRAEVTLTDLPKDSTLTLNYSGDTLYRSSSQQIRAVEARRRSARH